MPIITIVRTFNFQMICLFLPLNLILTHTAELVYVIYSQSVNGMVQTVPLLTVTSFTPQLRGNFHFLINHIITTASSKITSWPPSHPSPSSALSLSFTHTICKPDRIYKCLVALQDCIISSSNTIHAFLILYQNIII